MRVVGALLHTATREEKVGNTQTKFSLSLCTQKCFVCVQMALLLPLLRLFALENRLSALVRWAIDTEIQSVVNVATLFRSDDYASRILSTYSKSVGLPFIQATLTAPVLALRALDIRDLELSPEKDPVRRVGACLYNRIKGSSDLMGVIQALQDAARVRRNAQHLMDACQIVIDAILRNAPSVRPTAPIPFHGRKVG